MKNMMHWNTAKTLRGKAGWVLRLGAFSLIFSLTLPSSLVTQSIAEEASSTSYLDVSAKDQGKERKRLEKREKKRKKKMEELNTTTLPFQEVSLEEHMRRKQEAKERLAYFKEELKRHREEGGLETAVIAEEKTAPAQSKEKLLTPTPVVSVPAAVGGAKGVAEEAKQAELDRNGQLLLERAQLQKELMQIEADEKRAKAEVFRQERKQLQEKLRRGRLKKQEEERELREAKRQQKLKEKRVREALEDKRKAVEREARQRELAEKREIEAAAKEKVVLKEADQILALAQAPIQDSAPQFNRQKINQHLRRAQDLVEAKSYGKAQDELSQALLLDPNNEIALSLMAATVENQFVAQRAEVDRQREMAKKIAGDRMRGKFIEMMTRIDEEIQQLNAEGNQYYKAGDFPQASQNYRKVRALETERQTITENILERLQNRQKMLTEEMTSEEKQRKAADLLRQAEILGKQERWDEAAAVYESIFLYDPMNKQASRGMDSLKRRFLDQEKQKANSADQIMKEDFQGRTSRYLEEAKAAKAAGDWERSKVLVRKALALNPGNKTAKRLIESLAK